MLCRGISSCDLSWRPYLAETNQLFERDLPLRSNQVTLRTEEHVRFEEAWPAIKDHCGRDVLSEDEAI